MRRPPGVLYGWGSDTFMILLSADPADVAVKDIEDQGKQEQTNEGKENVIDEALAAVGGFVKGKLELGVDELVLQLGEFVLHAGAGQDYIKKGVQRDAERGTDAPDGVDGRVFGFTAQELRNGIFGNAGNLREVGICEARNVLFFGFAA